jgi:diguanylate cyclase (GGDEF)-like protein
MYKYLKSGKIFARRIILRQIRTIALFLIIPLSFCLVHSNHLLFLYLLTGFGLFIPIAEYLPAKKTFFKDRVTVFNWLIIICTNLFYSGIILISGGTNSPLVGLFLIPILTFALEFGLPVGSINLFPPLILIMADSLVRPISSMSFPLVILLIDCATLVTIGSYKHYADYYDRKLLGLLTKDELTGLYNRRYLKTKILEEIKQCHSFALIIMDVNYFKYYNDRWGHPSGDRLLITFSRILMRAVRKTDIIVRYSGDEFFVFLPQASTSDIDQIMAKINQIIDEKLIPGDECFPNRRLSISFGAVRYPDDAKTFESLIIEADHALYKYKNRRQNVRSAL